MTAAAEKRRLAVWRRVFAACDAQLGFAKRPRCDTVAALAAHFGSTAADFEQWRRDSEMFRGATNGLIGVPNTAHQCAPRDAGAATPKKAAPRASQPPKPPTPAKPAKPRRHYAWHDWLEAIQASTHTYRSRAALAAAVGASPAGFRHACLVNAELRAAADARLEPPAARSSQQ